MALDHANGQLVTVAAIATVQTIGGFLKHKHRSSRPGGLDSRRLAGGAQAHKSSARPSTSR